MADVLNFEILKQHEYVLIFIFVVPSYYTAPCSMHATYKVHIRLKYHGKLRVHVHKNVWFCMSNFHGVFSLQFGRRLIEFDNYFGSNRNPECRSLLCHHLFKWLSNALAYSTLTMTLI